MSMVPARFLHVYVRTYNTQLCMCVELGHNYSTVLMVLSQVVSVDVSAVELKTYSELVQMGALAKTTALQLPQ